MFAPASLGNLTEFLAEPRLHVAQMTIDFGSFLGDLVFLLLNLLDTLGQFLGRGLDLFFAAIEAGLALMQRLLQAGKTALPLDELLPE